jgi:hypothetical protein
MSWRRVLQGALIGIVCGVVGLSADTWRGWFAIIALYLIRHISPERGTA